MVRTQHDVTVDAYEKKIGDLQSDKALLDNKCADPASPDLPFEKMFELSKLFFQTPMKFGKKVA
jgi:hypothetical protein